VPARPKLLPSYRSPTYRVTSFSTESAGSPCQFRPTATREESGNRPAIRDGMDVAGRTRDAGLACRPSVPPSHKFPCSVTRHPSPRALRLKARKKKRVRKISSYAGQEFHLMPELSSQVVDSVDRPISLYDGTHIYDDLLLWRAIALLLAVLSAFSS
jgi:hypothetical protein